MNHQLKKVVVLGHFGFGAFKSNGQTIKTKILAGELQNIIGHEQTDLEDTMGGWRFLLTWPLKAFKMLRQHKNAVFLPAYRGVRIIVPTLVLLNIFFRRRLHYVVIGGWLPAFVPRYRLLRWSLHHVDRIYAETHFMLKQMEELGYDNVKVMPNCKPLRIVTAAESLTQSAPPYRLCTFSRVMKEKGIEDAIDAVVRCNKKAGQTLFRLDIFGLIEKGQEEWFQQLMSQQPEYIRYGGIVEYDKSTDVLQNYFALLFPTRFRTEGVAGTLIDALAAALPSIVTDIPSNREILEEGKTGLFFSIQNVEQLANILNDIALHPESINKMKRTCCQHAAKYLPENVVRTLTNEMI